MSEHPPRERLRGRDPNLAPKARPIVDSKVELFVPASTKPVQVKNAHAQRMAYYFALPLGVFALMAAVAVWVFLVVAREGQTPRKRVNSTAVKAEDTPAGITPHNISGEEFLRDLPSELPGPEILSSGVRTPKLAMNQPGIPADALPPLQEVTSPARARAACDVVKSFMLGDTLNEKVALTTDPEAVRNLVQGRYREGAIRRIETRELTCEKQFERGKHVFMVVDATLFDFSRRQYVVQMDNFKGRLVVNDAASLLP